MGRVINMDGNGFTDVWTSIAGEKTIYQQLSPALDMYQKGTLSFTELYEMYQKLTASDKTYTNPLDSFKNTKTKNEQGNTHIYNKKQLLKYMHEELGFAADKIDVCTSSGVRAYVIKDNKLHMVKLSYYYGLSKERVREKLIQAGLLDGNQEIKEENTGEDLSEI